MPYELALPKIYSSTEIFSVHVRCCRDQQVFLISSLSLSYLGMPVELPNFVSCSFLQAILAKHLNDADLTLIGFSGDLATKKGENYASEMYRIHVEYELRGAIKTKSVILKLIPSGIIQVVVMEKNNVYPREIQVYSEFLVEVDKLLTSVGDTTKFAPTCLYTSNEPKQLLVFEDMKELGYTTYPRHRQINYDEALPIIVKLSKLHAASVVLNERNPAIMDLYREGSISVNPERQDFLVHYMNCARALGKVAENEWGPRWTEIAGKLKKFQYKIVQKGCDLYVRDENAFNVFNHNDLWTPNVLVKFDEHSSIEDVMFVDFQLNYFGSPGIDLNFFFYGSLSEETRLTFKTKLIKVYHQSLAESLVKFGYSKPVPTLHDIHVEILKTGMNSLIAAFAEVPLLICEQSENLDMDTLLQDSDSAEAFRYTLFNNPKYKLFIQPLLLEFDDYGYMD